MLTTQDKNYISSEVAGQIGNALKKNNEILIKGMADLFDAANERMDGMTQRMDGMTQRMDGMNKRIDNVLNKLKDHHDIINNHERRMEKVEEKIFTTTIA